MSVMSVMYLISRRTEMSKTKLMVLVSLYGWWVALALYAASQKD